MYNLPELMSENLVDRGTNSIRSEAQPDCNIFIQIKTRYVAAAVGISPSNRFHRCGTLLITNAF
jgi:hypothetical protein